jgi:hypothetical protein
MSLAGIFHTDNTGYLELSGFPYSWDFSLFLRVGLLAWIEQDGGPPTLCACTSAGWSNLGPIKPAC